MVEFERSQQPPSKVSLDIKQLPTMLANKSNTEMVKELQKYGTVSIMPPPNGFKGPDLDQMKKFSLKVEMKDGTSNTIDIQNSSLIINSTIFDKTTGKEVSRDTIEKGLDKLLKDGKIDKAQREEYAKMSTVDVLKTLAAKNLLDELLKYVNREISRKGGVESAPAERQMEHQQNITLNKKQETEENLLSARVNTLLDKPGKDA